MEALGLDIKLLVAQIINFGILYFVLKKLLYKPILKLLDDRKKAIERSLDNSKKIEEELSKLEVKKASIITTVQNEAKKDKEKLIVLAQEEKRKIIDEAKKTAEAEVAKSVKKIQVAQDASFENVKKKFLNETVDALIKKINSSQNKSKFTDNILK
jgi:F-type H+-transporting ATPase subunit b